MNSEIRDRFIRMAKKAIAAVDASREKLGVLIGAKHFREILFTGSATEANNLALRGAIELYKKEHPGGHAAHHHFFDRA